MVCVGRLCKVQGILTRLDSPPVFATSVRYVACVISLSLQSILFGLRSSPFIQAICVLLILERLN